MRKEVRNVKKDAVKTFAGYHRSRFDTVSFWASDRKHELHESIHYNSGGEVTYIEFVPNNPKIVVKGYGLEIETENWAINDANVFTNVWHGYIANGLPGDLFRCEYDCSLSGGLVGVECVSQIMSKEFIRNNYSGFHNLFKRMQCTKTSASESGNCGMHVNISNSCFGRTEDTQKECLKKLFYIVNNHYNYILPMTCRKLSRTRYCGRMDATKDYAKNIDFNNMPSSHVNCLNYSHFREGRVELRFIAGQPDFKAFRATMELIFHLVGRLKELSWTDCDDLAKVFSGCNKYVIEAVKKGNLPMNTLNEIIANADMDTDYTLHD